MNVVPPSPEDRRDPLSDEEDWRGEDPIAGENPDDDVLPVSPGRRRVAMVFGLIFLAVVLGFLIVFTVTNAERRQGGPLGSLSPTAFEGSVA